MKLTARNKQKYVGPSSTPPTSSGSSSFLSRDEESALPSNIPNDKSPSSPYSRLSRVHRSTASSSYNLIISLLRKLCSSPNSHNEPDETFLVNILKDVIIGTTLGILFVFVLLFLDYRNFTHLGSARAFREAAIKLVTDPQTIRHVEESLDVKFISVDMYNAFNAETEKIQNKIKEREREIADNAKKIDHYRTEAAPYNGEYEKLISKANELFELDKFCPECGWKGSKKTTCASRMSFLMERYGDTPLKAKMATMESPGCKRE